MQMPSKVRALFNMNNKVLPTRNDLVSIIDLFLKSCGCDVDGHTIKIKLNGYVYIITRSVEETKK